MDVLREANRRRESSVVETPLDLIRLLNSRRESTIIETPLDLIRVLNREKARREITERILERLKHIENR